MKLITQNFITGEIQQAFHTKEEFLTSLSAVFQGDDKIKKVVTSCLDDLTNGHLLQLQFVIADESRESCGFQILPVFAAPGVDVQSKHVASVVIRPDKTVEVFEARHPAKDTSNLIYAIEELEHGATIH